MSEKDGYKEEENLQIGKDRAVNLFQAVGRGRVDGQIHLRNGLELKQRKGRENLLCRHKDDNVSTTSLISLGNCALVTMKEEILRSCSKSRKRLIWG